MRNNVSLMRTGMVCILHSECVCKKWVFTNVCQFIMINAISVTAVLNTSVLKGGDIGYVSLPFLAMSGWDTLFILNNILSDAGL